MMTAAPPSTNGEDLRAFAIGSGAGAGVSAVAASATSEPTPAVPSSASAVDPSQVELLVVPSDQARPGCAERDRSLRIGVDRDRPIEALGEPLGDVGDA